MNKRPTPSIDDQQAIAGLRKAFVSADFDSAGAKEALHTSGELLIPKSDQIPIVLEGLPDDSRLSSLIKLFVVGLAVERKEAKAALAPLSAERASALGLITLADGWVEPLVNIVPFRDLYLAFDINESDAELVMGITPSSTFLANMTPRHSVGSTLDLGTGCGFQALLAASHSEEVIATDANPRAIQFTRFNTLLNGITNVDVREGNWFEPVKGMRFDLIVSNPPFVVSPDFEYLFRDSDSPGDAISRMLIQAAPRYLAEDGTAILMMGWIVRVGEAWVEPLQRWVENGNYDAWFLRASSDDPLGYATGWNAHLREDQTKYTKAFNRWIEFYRSERVESIGYGATVLRRRPGPNWVRADNLRGGLEEPVGEAVATLGRIEDELFLRADRKSLLSTKPRFTENHRLEQVLRMENGGYVVQAAALQLEEGLQFRVDMDPFRAQLVSRLDGSRSLAEAIADAQSVLAPDANKEDFIEAGLVVAEQMLRLGFLSLEIS